MNNFSQPGNILTLTAPSGGVVSGTPYLIGGILVVAEISADETLPFSGVRTGVFTLGKATGETWAEGDKLYWDNSAHKFTKTAAANSSAGFAVAVAGSSDTTGQVLLVTLEGAGAPGTSVADLSAWSNLTGVDGTSSNAAPLAGVNTTFSALYTKVNAVIDALKTAGILS